MDPSEKGSAFSWRYWRTKDLKQEARIVTYQIPQLRQVSSHLEIQTLAPCRGDQVRRQSESSCLREVPQVRFRPSLRQPPFLVMATLPSLRPFFSASTDRKSTRLNSVTATS